MPKATVGFTDGRGRLHSTAKMATVSDIAALFGSMEGMATGIAHTILEKRSDLERIFAEFDDISGKVRSDGSH